MTKQQIDSKIVSIEEYRRRKMEAMKAEPEADEKDEGQSEIHVVKPESPEIGVA